ncbi:hypothetical protein BS47DRAFT_1071918 [Hydnum rufescens UP504]|uniref:Nucleoside diphosphate kinase n=1 Tax=Hydnum rufescens UP504 TaxID=1448309 RepID=A0A9P6B8T3_9AGAM|nr:hypothetical protein BS47DRAFT_1071918 [Hydnum rufescens UP504]
MSIPCSRTFAIIKPNFLHHRLNIESLLSEAGFEIIKERQIAFHPSDESLVHIFGEEAHTLTEGAVWVYVLEKENAVSDLLALIDDDGANAAQVNAQSIRATFGRSLENGIYGAPDCDAAEMQIATIFASSPPFPPAEMSPNDGDVPVLTDLSFTNSQRPALKKPRSLGCRETPVPGSAQDQCHRQLPSPPYNRGLRVPLHSAQALFPLHLPLKCAAPQPKKIWLERSLMSQVTSVRLVLLSHPLRRPSLHPDPRAHRCSELVVNLFSTPLVLGHQQP